ncbi:hypothetical protein P7C70_g4811, partial [Phenoliferia sp. Uapishka_3]
MVGRALGLFTPRRSNIAFSPTRAVLDLKLSELSPERATDFNLQALVLFTLIINNAAEELVALALKRLGVVVEGDREVLECVEKWMGLLKKAKAKGFKGKWET